METSEIKRVGIETEIVTSLKRICGGGIHRKISSSSSSSSLSCNCSASSQPFSVIRDNTRNSHQSWSQKLEELAHTSILYPPHHKHKNSTQHIEKAHDIEVKIAPNLYHRYKHKCLKTSEDDEGIPKPPLEVISDLGLIRSVYCPRDLAKLIVQDVEDALWRERVDRDDANTEMQQPQSNNSCCRRMRHPYEIKYDLSGIICIVTPQRNEFLQSYRINRLPCPYPDCVKWAKGSKGLWWHMQREHGVDYSIAMGVANDGDKHHESRAIVLYSSGDDHIDDCDDDQIYSTTEERDLQIKDWDDDAYFQLVKEGNLSDLMTYLTSSTNNSNVTISSLDKNGASALHWAAGCGHLSIVQYLIQTHSVPPDQRQRGKRSFQDRTPLHWAARNGHLSVVKYLVEECAGNGKGVNLDSVTVDGTTAFCWACWQNHQEIMKYLYDKGADVRKVNSFGCNAVLWSAQSVISGLESLQWLKAIGLDVGLINSNGHGMLHKSAQRGKEHVCRWVFESATQGENSMDLLLQVAPDAEDCCPSDLAGMEGFEVLARWLVIQEQKISQRYFDDSSEDGCPRWLKDGVANARHTSNRYGLEGTYERGAAVKKMCARIAESQEASSRSKRPRAGGD